MWRRAAGYAAWAVVVVLVVWATWWPPTAYFVMGVLLKVIGATLIGVTLGASDRALKAGLVKETKLVWLLGAMIWIWGGKSVLRAVLKSHSIDLMTRGLNQMPPPWWFIALGACTFIVIVVCMLRLKRMRLGKGLGDQGPEASPSAQGSRL